MATTAKPTPTTAPGVAVVVVPTAQGSVARSNPPPGAHADPAAAAHEPALAPHTELAADTPCRGGLLHPMASLTLRALELVARALGAPLARLNPRTRDLIGYLGLATIGVSVCAMLLQPMLVSRRPITDIIRQQADAARTAREAPPAAGPHTAPPASTSGH